MLCALAIMCELFDFGEMLWILDFQLLRAALALTFIMTASIMKWKLRMLCCLFRTKIVCCQQSLMSHHCVWEILICARSANITYRLMCEMATIRVKWKTFYSHSEMENTEKLYRIVLRHIRTGSSRKTLEWKCQLDMSTYTRVHRGELAVEITREFLNWWQWYQSRYFIQLLLWHGSGCALWGIEAESEQVLIVEKLLELFHACARNSQWELSALMMMECRKKSVREWNVSMSIKVDSSSW